MPIAFMRAPVVPAKSIPPKYELVVASYYGLLEF